MDIIHSFCYVRVPCVNEINVLLFYLQRNHPCQVVSFGPWVFVPRLSVNLGFPLSGPAAFTNSVIATVMHYDITPEHFFDEVTLVKRCCSSCQLSLFYLTFGAAAQHRGHITVV